jgi:hypothetical protein
MRTFLFAMVMLWVGVASANPWVVCDTQPMTDGFSYTMDSSAWTDTAYNARTCTDGPCADVAEIGWVTPGDHSMVVKAFNNTISPETGKRYESSVVPFSFTRPFPPLNSTGGKLVP